MWRNRVDKSQNERETRPVEEVDWLKEVKILDGEKALLTVRTRSGNTVLYQVPTEYLLPLREEANGARPDHVNDGI